MSNVDYIEQYKANFKKALEEGNNSELIFWIIKICENYSHDDAIANLKELVNLSRKYNKAEFINKELGKIATTGFDLGNYEYMLILYQKMMISVE